MLNIMTVFYFIKCQSINSLNILKRYSFVLYLMTESSTNTASLA